jgi:hypothetical protein
MSPKQWEQKEEVGGVFPQPAGQLWECLCECDACIHSIRAPHALPCPGCEIFVLAVDHTCPDCGDGSTSVPELELYEQHSNSTSAYGYDSDGNMTEIPVYHSPEQTVSTPNSSGGHEDGPET